VFWMETLPAAGLPLI
jgi:hypothetical protein